MSAVMGLAVDVSAGEDGERKKLELPSLQRKSVAGLGAHPGWDRRRKKRMSRWTYKLVGRQTIVGTLALLLLLAVSATPSQAHFTTTPSPTPTCQTGSWPWGSGFFDGDLSGISCVSS
jgi:hypothetical protein